MASLQDVRKDIEATLAAIREIEKQIIEKNDNSSNEESMKRALNDYITKLEQLYTRMIQAQSNLLLVSVRGDALMEAWTGPAMNSCQASMTLRMPASLCISIRKIIQQNVCKIQNSMIVKEVSWVASTVEWTGWPMKSVSPNRHTMFCQTVILPHRQASFPFGSMTDKAVVH